MATNQVFLWDVIYWWNEDTNEYDQVDYVPTVWSSENKQKFKFSCWKENKRDEKEAFD